MRPTPEQIRAALEHAVRAAELDGPPPAAEVAPLHPLAPPPPRRARPLLAAAAAVVLALGLAAVVARGGGPDRAEAVATSTPTAGTVAVGLDVADLVLVHALDWPAAGGADGSAEPAASLAVYRGPGSAWLAVEVREGDQRGSLDAFADLLVETATVDGVTVRSAPPGLPADSAVLGLGLSSWARDGRTYTVASRGLAAAAHDEQVRALVGAAVAGEPVVPAGAGVTLVAHGPDANPFHRPRTLASATYRSGAGDLVAVHLSAAAGGDLARYAWYRSGAEVLDVGGRPAVLADGADGRASLWVRLPAGLVQLDGPRDVLPELAAHLRPLDGAAWEEALATLPEAGVAGGRAGPSLTGAERSAVAADVEARAAAAG